MKLNKLKLNQLSDADLNEREMVRILGGGTPGCCQSGCNYAGESGGSSSSANDANGYTSDPGSHPCCDDPISQNNWSCGTHLSCYPGEGTNISCYP